MHPDMFVARAQAVKEFWKQLRQIAFVPLSGLNAQIVTQNKHLASGPLYATFVYV